MGFLFSEALGIPVVIRNDARVATIAESVFGAGRGVRDVVYINGSPSGIGGGAVVDGITLRGHAGFGGEIGHTAVAGGRDQCHCGRRGCLETEVSLARLLVALGRDSVDLVDLDDELARAGADPTIRAEIQRQLSVLAGAIGNVISIFNPELVVLAGFLGSLYATAPTMLDSAVAKDSFAQISSGTRIERAQLGGTGPPGGRRRTGVLAAVARPCGVRPQRAAVRYSAQATPTTRRRGQGELPPLSSRSSTTRKTAATDPARSPPPSCTNTNSPGRHDSAQAIRQHVDVLFDPVLDTY